MADQFPPDVEERIKAQLATGQYASEADVIRDALQALEDYRRYQRELSDLKAKLRQAEEESRQGQSAPFDAEATKRAVRQRLAQQGITD
ncbi:MAG: hypothetical protein DWQ37_12915 [Planctomycetota bacterium]|nr:MAG: hypothetical protein DWQ37_12915 [Planctomycetota bacterium]